MDETQAHPAGNKRSLRPDDGIQKRKRRVGLLQEMRVMACQGVIGQQTQPVHLAACSEELEGAHTDMACGDPGQHRARQTRVALHPFARGCGRKCARRGNAHRMHRLADQIFPQDGAQRRLAVAAP